MNYFCSAYPEVVKGEVGQSHAGDVFWELLQDLRVLCLQVDKKKKRITSHKPPKSTACYWLKATHMMLVLHACFTRPWISEGLSKSGGCGTEWDTFFVSWRDSRDAIYLNHCDYTEYISDSDSGHWIRSVLHLLINIDWLNVNVNCIVHFTMNYKLKLFVYLLGNHWPDSLR